MSAPRPQFYHPAPAIADALAGIERVVRRAEGVALVVGPPGTGKSLLLAKVAEHVRDDFDVVLLSGARILTRRALWQSILSELGEPYRGIDEGDLRLAVVERIRSLAATGSGLVLLVDEAHTLPTRLVEELRLLTNVPTPLPAVHIVLAGATRLEEMLGLSRLESLAQRIALRSYLEPLDHAETARYLHAQTRAAGLDWEKLFASGCEDAVFTATDGVPRLVNRLCDHALVLVDSSRRVGPEDIARAWRDIQRLPLPRHGCAAAGPQADRDRGSAGVEADDSPAAESPPDVIEFGDLSGDEIEAVGGGVVSLDPEAGGGSARRGLDDPWSGPDVELTVADAGDPFAEIFDHEERVVERYSRADEFRGCGLVHSREGLALARLLDACQAEVRLPEMPASGAGTAEDPEPVPPHAEPEAVAADDSDLLVIEEDGEEYRPVAGTVSAVRPGDYRSLFSRLRRGDRG